MPQVKALSNQATTNLDAMRAAAVSTEAKQQLLDASASLAEFVAIDKRAQDYVSAEQPLMASDVVFSEASDAVTDVTRQVESARLAEQQELDTEDAARRRQQIYAASGGMAFAALVLVMMGLTAPTSTQSAVDGARVGSEATPASSPESLSLRPTVAPERPPAALVIAEEPTRDAVALGAAADVCTAFGCVQDLAALKRALAQAAHAIDASGLVVWIGSAEGADLRAVVAHGYSDQVLQLMRPVSKQADNAAAAAYRTGNLQIVPAKPGTSLGAVVAPIMAAEGCIGAFTAEIRDNGEVSETVHAMAAIFASQLSGVLASSVSQPTSTATPSHAASA